jgi:hypothetical protein
MKLKARVKPRLLLNAKDKGIEVKQAYVVEVLLNRKWRIGEDDTGPWKFKTAAEAEAKKATLVGLEVQTELPVAP